MSVHYQCKALIDRLLKESSSQDLFASLERARKLSSALHHPERAYPVIHIAGSNGKGSTSTKIARALEDAGYQTGLYTSPHWNLFQERMQINQHLISEEAITQILPHIYEAAEKSNIEPSFFELTTFLAFEWFYRENIEVAVVETGLGGALDATNVVFPILSVITSISLDHVDRLGKTLEEISQQKAGIIKKGIPVVVGPKARFSPIYDQANRLGSPILQVEECDGWYDIENQHIAQKALEFLQKQFPKLQGKWDRALQVRPPCRFELYEGAILDVAHNLDGLTRLYEAIAIAFPGRAVRTVLGMARDKDLVGCLKLAQKRSSYVHLVRADNKRAATAKEFAPHDFSRCVEEETVIIGVQNAKRKADLLGEILVITGSFHLMLDAKKALCSCLPESPLASELLNL
jgi:dihydrofolate synthase / folylpolyglutamate synthase